MLGFRNSRVAMLASALVMGLGSIPAAMTQPAITQASPRVTRSEKRSLFGAGRSASLYGRKGAGISMAQQKRTAAKKRSVARNRRNHR